jgi:integrase/recombinase XerD
MNMPSNFPILMEAFFTDRLMRQRNASPHTVAAYRDTFRLLFAYAWQTLHKAPSSLTLDDLSSPFIGAFLDHLEQDRGNTARTRNARLAAIHAFFRYLVFEQPEKSALVQRVLAMPSKRCERALVAYLMPNEIRALLDAPDRSCWSGRRDHAILQLAVQTGLRVSELTGLCCESLALETGAHVRCLGKGRKTRCTPLTRSTSAILRAWLWERNGAPTEPLFPNRRGGRLATDGVAYILAKHAITAGRSCPSLITKRVSPHVLRHTAAMTLLHAGVDCTVIALWLGHERLETTQIYLTADMAEKERIMEKASFPKSRAKRFHPDDALLAFLKGL